MPPIDSWRVMIGAASVAMSASSTCALWLICRAILGCRAESVGGAAAPSLWIVAMGSSSCCAGTGAGPTLDDPPPAPRKRTTVDGDVSAVRSSMVGLHLPTMAQDAAGARTALSSALARNSSVGRSGCHYPCCAST